MRIAPLADVKARLSGYLERVASEGPVIITRNGKPVAVLLAPRDEEDLERLVLAHSPRFLALLEKSRASVEAGRGLTSSAFWKAVAERRGKAKGKVGDDPRFHRRVKAARQSLRAGKGTKLENLDPSS
jgi:prevent-host-death family protein